MNRLTIYSLETGEILRTVQNVSVEGCYNPECEGAIEGTFSPDEFYFNKGKLTPLKDMNVRVNGLELSNIPSGAEIYFQGAPIEAAKKWTAPHPGLVMIMKPNYKTVMLHLPEHHFKRKDAYPEIEEQLDAIYKGFVAIKAAGIELPLETEAWLNNIASIKKQHPK